MYAIVWDPAILTHTQKDPPPFIEGWSGETKEANCWDGVPSFRRHPYEASES